MEHCLHIQKPFLFLMCFTSELYSVKILVMKRVKWIAGLFIIIASVLVITAFGWLLLRGEEKSAVVANQPEADLILINSQLVEFERGIPVYSLAVTETEVNREKNRALLHGVIAHYYDEGTATLHLTAATGVVDIRTGDAMITGNPQILGPSRYLLTTDKINYHSERRYLSADGDVRIAGPLFDLTGRGLEYYPEGQTFTIKENVKTVIESSQAEASAGAFR
jgi:LPS export ABC transporter protein LptC